MKYKFIGTEQDLIDTYFLRELNHLMQKGLQDLIDKGLVGVENE